LPGNDGQPGRDGNNTPVQGYENVLMSKISADLGQPGQPGPVGPAGASGKL